MLESPLREIEILRIEHARALTINPLGRSSGSGKRSGGFIPLVDAWI